MESAQEEQLLRVFACRGKSRADFGRVVIIYFFFLLFIYTTTKLCVGFCSPLWFFHLQQHPRIVRFLGEIKQFFWIWHCDH